MYLVRAAHSIAYAICRSEGRRLGQLGGCQPSQRLTEDINSGTRKGLLQLAATLYSRHQILAQW